MKSVYLSASIRCMDADAEPTVTISQSAAIAISRLLWSVASLDVTSHQDAVDCWHWGAYLDHQAGLPPHPTGGHPTVKVIEFYENIRSAIDDRIRALRAETPPTQLDDSTE
jgi:hypothetical protein